MLTHRRTHTQYETWSEPTVLVVDTMGGHEEVPEGTVALLTGGVSLDILSHSAVRARNMGVVMAACFGPQAMADIKALAGSRVAVSLAGSDVHVTHA
jgi:alpha-glucan,water dikinase